MNLKFGKIEERGPDAIRKVNAHSIMSLASRNNLPTQASVLPLCKLPLCLPHRSSCCTQVEEWSDAVR